MERLDESIKEEADGIHNSLGKCGSVILLAAMLVLVVCAINSAVCVFH